MRTIFVYSIILEIDHEISFHFRCKWRRKNCERLAASETAAAAATKAGVCAVTLPLESSGRGY